MAENLQHEDFGEKIGGAKKDLWKDRGLYVDDLGSMNEREAEKFVKKDNVWKKPDYQAMLDGGVSLGVVYFIKKARDSLGASPQYRYSDKTPELRRARQEEYIETVRQLQAMIEDVRTLDDAMQAYDRFLIQNGYVEQVQGWASGTHYRATKKALDNPVITNSWCRPYISAPLLTLTGISRRRRSRNSLAFPKTRRCQRAMRSTSMTGKTPIPEITTGNPAPIM